MKKVAVLALASTILAADAYSTYVVVLKNGTTYKAKAKWTVSNGKALVTLENGQTLQLDPALLDEAKSEQATARGLGSAQVLVSGAQSQPAPQPTQAPSLGAGIQLRRPTTSSQPQQARPAAVPAGAPMTSPPVPAASGAMSQEIIDKFARAYENVGLYEQKLTGVSSNVLRAELTADSEDKVFNAISATSFLMVRNAGVSGVRIDMVELFMKTTNGGSSGRFQMTRDDAQMLDEKKVSQQDYFVRRVIY